MGPLIPQRHPPLTLRNFQVVTAEDGSKSPPQLEVFNVQDDISGTGFIRVMFEAFDPVSGERITDINGYSQLWPMDFDPQRTSDYVPNADGYFEGSIPINEFAPDAIYKIATIQTRDLAENWKIWGNPMIETREYFQEELPELASHATMEIAPGSLQRHKNLTDIDLSGLDLRGVDFTGSNLRGVNFSGSDLSGAKFNNVVLSENDFSGTTLIGANFQILPAQIGSALISTIRI